MGIFTSDFSSNSIDQELKNPNELLEAYIADELSFAPEEKLQEFVNSPEADAMIEAGLITRKTLMRLSKNDDLTRRTKIAALQLAKEANDPLYKKYVKAHMMKRQLAEKILTKYSTKATKSARLGQRAYIKTKMPISMMRPTSKDFK